MNLSLLPENSLIMLDPSVLFHALVVPEQYEAERQLETISTEKFGDQKVARQTVSMLHQGRLVTDDCRHFLNRVAAGHYWAVMTSYQVTGIWKRLLAFEAHAKKALQMADRDPEPLRPVHGLKVTPDFAAERMENLLRSNVEILPVLQRDHLLALQLRRRFSLKLLDALNLAAGLRVSRPVLQIAATSDRFKAMEKYRRVINYAPAQSSYVNGYYSR